MNDIYLPFYASFEYEKVNKITHSLLKKFTVSHMKYRIKCSRKKLLEKIEKLFNIFRLEIWKSAWILRVCMALLQFNWIQFRWRFVSSSLISRKFSIRKKSAKRYHRNVVWLALATLRHTWEEWNERAKKIITKKPNRNELQRISLQNAYEQNAVFIIQWQKKRE